MRSRLLMIFSPPSSNRATWPVHDLARPSPAPPTRPAASGRRSSMPARRAALSVSDVLVAPVSSRARVRVPLMSTFMRIAVSARCCSSSGTTTTGASPAQWAKFVLSQSPFGTLRRTTPCARSYSVSAADRMLRPRIPPMPAPSSLPPTRNCDVGAARRRAAPPFPRGSAWPRPDRCSPGPATPEGRSRKGRFSCVAVDALSMLKKAPLSTSIGTAVPLSVRVAIGR